MQIIDLRDWNISYTELVRWCGETGAEVYAVNYHGSNTTSSKYAFTVDEDFIAFKLAFFKEQVPSMSFYTNGVCRLTI